MIDAANCLESLSLSIVMKVGVKSLSSGTLVSLVVQRYSHFLHSLLRRIEVDVDFLESMTSDSWWPQAGHFIDKDLL